MDVMSLKEACSFLAMFAIKCPIDKILDCLSQIGWFDSKDWTIRNKTIDKNTDILKALHKIA